jgi:hypothetical protein
MRSWIRYSTVAATAVATAVAACQFAPRLGTGDDGLPIDALPAADAGPCETVGVACASDGTLRTCTTVNQAPIDTACAWGCLGSDATAHCGVFVPSGGAATTLDLGSNAQLDNVSITGNGDLNGDDGTFGNLRTSSDKNTPYKNGVFFQLRGNIAVFKVKSLTISAALNVLGGHPIVIIRRHQERDGERRWQGWWNRRQARRWWRWQRCGRWQWRCRWRDPGRGRPGVRRCDDHAPGWRWRWWGRW